ncbi:MAG TPA: cache domain-containing protein, partial [Bryobacteraceae bacterium]|nr:cache domain-containing protein [Bryobacteraceae bacterium]
MKSPATGRPVVLLTAPIKAGTQVVGILGTPIELSNFSDSFVSKYRFRETGYVYMFDASGLVFAHPDASKIMSLNIAKTDFSGEMVSRANGSLSYVFEGIARTACFRRAQVKPWTIVAVVPDRELFASVRTIQFYLLLFARDTSALIEESLSKSQDGKHQLDNVLQAMEANNKIAGAVKA